VRISRERRLYPSRVSETFALERSGALRRGRKLQYFTVGWNLLEGLVAVVAGSFAGSISLIGFGIDSFVEVVSGAAVLWRIRVDSDVERRELNEKRALKVVGGCFLALAAYIAYESVMDLWSKTAPEHSVPGILLACASLVVMPMLSRAKFKVGSVLQSAAMNADAKQTQFCTYLSGILLGGLLLNAFLGLWWADPLAALLMAPIIANEGIENLRGTHCQDCVA
jgi:divalent metal cation (Fe/Co/Zn/Cd) transporter